MRRYMIIFVISEKGSYPIFKYQMYYLVDVWDKPALFAYETGVDPLSRWKNRKCIQKTGKN